MARTRYRYVYKSVPSVWQLGDSAGLPYCIQKQSPSQNFLSVPLPEEEGHRERAALETFQVTEDASETETEEPTTSYGVTERSLPRHRGLRWVYSMLFGESSDLEEAAVNHQFSRAERERLSNVESIDYLPPNSSVFRKWLSAQPHGLGLTQLSKFSTSLSIAEKVSFVNRAWLLLCVLSLPTATFMVLQAPMGSLVHDGLYRCHSRHHLLLLEDVH